MSPRDRAYVACSWGGSYRSYSPEGAYPSRAPRRHRVVIDRALDEHGAILAVLPGALETVHAWVCAGDGILHYVYVAGAVRGHGVARALVRLALGDYPARIVTSHPWPRVNARFVQKIRSAA